MAADTATHQREARRIGWCLLIGAVMDFPIAWLLSWRGGTMASGSEELAVAEAPRARSVERRFGPPFSAMRRDLHSLGLTQYEVEHSKATLEEIQTSRAVTESWDTRSGPAVGIATIWHIGVPWRSMQILDLGWVGEKAERQAIWWGSTSSIEKGWRFEYPFRSHIIGLALQPLPIGFALNTLVYAAGLWGVRYGPGRIRRFNRRRRGLCVTCGYDIAGLPRCPECGAVDSRQKHEPPVERTVAQEH